MSKKGNKCKKASGKKSAKSKKALSGTTTKVSKPHTSLMERKSLSGLAKIKQQQSKSLTGLAALRDRNQKLSSTMRLKIGSTIHFLIDADGLSGIPWLDPKEKVEGTITGIKEGLGIYIVSKHGDHYRKFTEL